jgi:large subunit ribosomal protein L35
MPKAKTHSGAKKRFRVTKTGKFLHRRMNRNHLLEKKPSARKRRLAQEGELEGGDRRQIRRLLGGR